MKFEDIQRVAVIGSGTMGAGISWCFAQAGYAVSLYDISREQLDKEHVRP